MEKIIKVMIVDDFESQRIRLKHIIERDDRFAIVGVATNGDEAVLLARSSKPDIILMDIEMESRDAGIIAARMIHEENERIKIIILTVHKDETTILAAFQTGIVDYLIKQQSPDIIIEAILLAHTDRSPMRPIIAEKLRDHLSHSEERERQLMFIIETISTLTNSELAILREIVDGKSRRAIADERCVELVTIKKHINSIHKKFGESSTRRIVDKIRKTNIFDILDTI